MLHCSVKVLLYDVDMTLGKRIKLARDRLGMKQRELAAEFGLTIQAISGWERDDSTPEFEKLPKLRKLLKVPFAWLLAGNGDPPPENDPTTAMDDLLVDMYEKRGSVADHPPAKSKIRSRV